MSNFDSSLPIRTQSNGDVVVKISDGTVTSRILTVNTDGSSNVRVLGRLVSEPFDSISAAYPTATQEVYSYYTGGLSGSLVGTVTINYTDSTKLVFVNAVRT